MSSYDYYRLLLVGIICFTIIVCVVKGSIADSYRLRQRAKNIKNAGWPPAHLDADGDLHRENDK